MVITLSLKEKKHAFNNEHHEQRIFRTRMLPILDSSWHEKTNMYFVL